MRYQEILTDDFNNGPGLRVSLWTVGCPHRCPGCHNPHLFDKTGGKEFTEETMEKLLKALREDVPRDFSVLGGEPLAPYNVHGVKEICSRVKKTYPEISIWLWSGYTLREIMSHPDRQAVLEYIDVLVEGRFIERYKQEGLPFRGSTNQHIYDLNASRLSGQPICIDKYAEDLMKF